MKFLTTLAISAALFLHAEPEIRTIYVARNKYKTLPQADEGVQIVDSPVSKSSVRKSLKPFLGQPMTPEVLRKMKKELVLCCRDHGHPLVSVSIPQQEVTKGTIVITLEESLLDNIEVHGNKHFSKETYSNAIELKKGEPIDENLLMENINFLNRNPFRRVDVLYTPGSDSKTTTIEVVTKEQTPWNIYAGADNTGLVHLDRIRWFSGFTWANVFGASQVFTAQYTAAPSVHKFQAVTASYSIPLPIQHQILLYGGYSSIHAPVPGSSKMHGQSGQASIRYDIPLRPSTWLLHEVTAGFDFKRSNNTLQFSEDLLIIGQEVNLTQFMAGYNLGYERKIHKIGFDLQCLFSPFSWIPNQSKHDFESLNPFAKPQYVYGKTSLNYKLQIPHGFMWTLLAAGQASNTTLLPSEQFGLGGYNTVRGYDERQLNTDGAALLSTEFHSPKFPIFKRDGLEFLVFLDYGLGFDHKKLPGEKKNNYLLGTGPGIRYVFENHFSARLDWGIKIHRSDFTGGWSMVHFSVIGSF